VEQLLSPEEKNAGFSIREEEDFLYLLRWGKVAAVFSSLGVTQEAIHEAIRQEMERGDKQ
jgi:hypothetical protein